MATISEYQRQNLKSSVMGTAGADYSTGQAFDAVAQGAGKVANVSFDLAVKRKEAMDFAVANESVLGLDIDMENTLRTHQDTMKNFQGSPIERAGFFQAQAEKLVQDRARLAPNDQVRRAILDQGTSMVSSRYRREIEAADKNQGVIAYTKINDAVKLSAEEAARVGADNSLSFKDKISRFEDLLNRSKTTVDAASIVLDPAQAQEFRTESPASIMRAAATGMVAKNPEQLLAVLNHKNKDGKSVFEGIFKPEEIVKFRKEAEQSALHFEDRKIQADLEANLDQVSQATDLSKRGDTVAALAMTEQMEDGPLKKSMRESFLREGITEADRVDKVFDLKNKFERLSEDRKQNVKEQKGKKTKGSMKATLEELIQFQAEVVEAHALGDIKDSVRNSYLVEFIPDLQKKSRPTAIAGFSSWVAKAWSGVKEVVPDKADAVNVHDDFQRRLQQSNDYTPEGVNKALLAALNEHRTNRFPKSLFLAGTTNATLDRDKSLVASGVKGRTDTPVSGKVPPATKVLIGRDKNGNAFKVTFDPEGNVVSREPVNGN